MKIFVCGFSGAGKSSWVKNLGNKSESYSNFQIVDSDDEVCKKWDISSDQLGKKIEEFGESAFRRIEKDIIIDLINQKNSMLVALGGGALDEEVFNLIKNSTDGHLVYLKIDFEICFNRINADHNRLLSKFSKDEVLERFKQREIYYLQADLIVDQEQIKSIDGLSSLVHTFK